MRRKSIARKCLEISGLFEAELLVELMLRYWEHPLADDSDFRILLLETAVEVLRVSVRGQVLMEDIPPRDMNLISAVWYSEWNSLPELPEEQARPRQAWLDKVRHAVPSCFCSPDDLN